MIVTRVDFPFGKLEVRAGVNELQIRRVYGGGRQKSRFTN
jgi:hypothetical protein